MLSTAGVVACGYRSGHEERPDSARLHVALSSFATPYPEAVEGVLTGARAELGREKALAGGEGYPALRLEVLRVDELSTGIAAVTSSAGERPLARGAAVGVVARGAIVERAGEPPIHDTGDIRRVEVVAQGADAVTSGVAFREAVRAASRKVGEALARRALGHAEPSIEPM